MSIRMHLRTLLLAGLCTFGALGGAGAAAQVNDALAAPYALDASDQRIQDILHRFAADHGLALHIEPSAKHQWRPAKLEGWVRGDTGRAFLEQLARAHRFSWFAADRRLYISSAHDAAVERIALNGARADSARAALQAVGIYDARFGWGELDGQDAVLVGGPKAYRALVRRFIVGQTKAQSTATEPEAMIFPLRFAKAGDDRPADPDAAVRPGIASLLRELLAPNTTAARPTFSLPTEPETIPPLPPLTPSLTQWIGYPPSTSNSVLASLRPRGASPATSSASTPVGIIADDATNSVIVWADRSWRANIEKFVDALDRPAPLVSVDVIVIEADLNTVMALAAASEARGEQPSASPSPFDSHLAHAMAEHRLRLLNRQLLVGRMNTHTVLAIGAEASHGGGANASDKANAEHANGRGGHHGDRLELAARIVPATRESATAIAVDVDFLMAQPTGLPGQIWANTSSVKFETSVTLESGSPPRLIASYPVATARAEQRAIFISARAL